METLAMRFFQGSGPSGLRGIPPIRGRYRRPLLNLEKRILLNFLKERGVPFIIDATNTKRDHLRNRVRHQLLPLAGSLFPGYRGSLVGLAEKMTLLQAMVREEMEERLPWGEEGGGSFSLEEETFWSVPEVLRRESLFDLADRTLPQERRIPYRFFKALKSPLAPKRGPILLRGFGYRLIRRGTKIFWEQDVVFPVKNHYLISIERNLSWFILDWNFTAVFMDGRDLKADAEALPGVRIEGNTIQPPLIIRSRREGDVIALPEGRKSLKKLYNYWGVSEEKRWIIPVLEDRGGILGILGEPWGYPNRFRVPSISGKDAAAQGYWLVSWMQGSKFGG